MIALNKVRKSERHGPVLKGGITKILSSTAVEKKF